MSKADIRWMPWGPGAFEAARISGRPLLVRLSAFWAARESASLRACLENGLAGPLAPDRFVLVEADADRVPELRLRYALGQVPSAFVLSADGTLLARLSALDPSRLRTVLAGVAAAASVDISSERAGLGVCAVPLVPPGEGNLERGIETLETLREAVQMALGRGFPSGVPVQAQAGALQFLLGRAAQTGDEEGVSWVVERLHELAHSPLYDAVEGGFFGEVEPSGPRPVKLLGQNAEWLILALRLSRDPGAAFAPSLARGILHYLQNHLLMPGGAFGHAQRDDSGYYRLAGDERRRVPSAEVDPTVYTASNALAVRALCKGWRLLGESAYLDQALRTYALLTSSMILPGGVAHAFPAEASGTGYLEDALEMGRAGLALYHSTLDPRYLDDVRAMAATVAKDFKNPAGEGFLDLLPAAQPKGVPKRPVVDRALNARAASFLLLASAQLEEESWAASARGALGALVDDPGDDLEALSLTGSALLVALSPMAVFEAITDGSREQRFQVLERLRQIGVSDAVVTHRCPAPKEGMQRLPRLVGTCGNQRHEILV